MRILVAAGGTGGHIFPAVAVMQQLLDHNCTVVWITTRRGNTADIARNYGLNRRVLNVEGLQRKISLQPLRALAKMSVATLGLLREIGSYDAVIAFGGYVCGPVLQAAGMRHIPIYLQEQNSVMGVVNKWYMKHARAVFLGMPLATSPQFQRNTLVTGNPVRPKKRDYSSFSYPPEVSPHTKTVLITGGSQGALSMNRALIPVVDYLCETAVQVVWQTGEASYTELAQRYASRAGVFVARSFPDMYPYYAISSLVIGRAGASTISETALFGIPAIFIPLPWAAENHQYYNALAVEKEGWAFLVKQNQAVSREVISILTELFEADSPLYKRCVANVLNTGRISATEIIVQEVISRDT
ncbi:MAG: undecaprenyldiphospho-muramoylpentapeptide beta-N-acetylglucosaminyltransferase [Fibrobacterota bacterium]